MTLDMKRSLIVIFVLSLSLISSFSNSYAEVGDFITNFVGIDVNGNGTEFRNPAPLATDSQDRIIVGDTFLDIVQIYDSEGLFVTDIDGSDPGDTAFINIIGLAVYSDDRIIVADNLAKTVDIYTSDGDFITNFVGIDVNGNGTAFVSPSGVEVDSEDRMIVVDYTLDIVQIYDSDGLFVTSFDGSDGDGEEFDFATGVTVDSQDRIIVTDLQNEIVQIYTPDGSFITSLDASDTDYGRFLAPFAVAVDSEDRIIVSDTNLNAVLIFKSDGSFFNILNITTSIDITGVEVDSQDRIIVSDFTLGLVQIFEGFAAPEDEPEPLKKSGGGGCPDCIAPTLGLNSFYVRVVDNGFSYNGNSVQVNKWHTPFPLINATVGETNTVKIIVYENQGINNMKLVQFGLGATEIGQPLTQVEVLIEVWLDINSNNFGIEEIIINDKDNLIESSSVVVVIDLVKCTSNSQNETCLKVTLQYSYREPTINNIMMVNLRDKPGNSQNFYLNEGVKVDGESLNEPPTYIIQNKQTHQQTEDFTLTLTRTDKVNHIWIDKYGIEYLQVSSDRFDRITPKSPIECNDPPLSEINVPTRLNCHFRALTSLWD